MMDSEEYPKYLNEKFDFAINDFYELTSRIPNQKMNWRKEIRNKAWDLSYIRILYLLLHKLVKFDFLNTKML